MALCNRKRGLVESCCGHQIWLHLGRVVLNGVGLWKYIRKGWRFFSSHTRFDPGHGSRIKFWGDVWCGEVCLKTVFPVLYNIALVKEALVATNIDLSSGTIH